jgi:hypothetical protein
MKLTASKLNKFSSLNCRQRLSLVRVATIDENNVVSVNTDGSIKTHSILCILLQWQN